MKHLKAVNQKAGRMEQYLKERERASAAAGQVAATGPGSEEPDVVALQQGPPQQPKALSPLGCTQIFSPGWEVDEGGGTAGLCQPVERDLFDCHLSCFWPAQVPDALHNAPDWTSGCASAQKDWRKIDLVFP